VLALLPLAIGSGEGSEIRGPMAVTIIGGLLASTAASVFVLPCLYLVLDRLRPGGRARTAA
jgi:multidrug efflux pump subunit AcrB